MKNPLYNCKLLLVQDSFKKNKVILSLSSMVSHDYGTKFD